MDATAVPSPVKRLAHIGSRAYGLLTAKGRLLPSFLICGGQRCGTTSLYRALAAHPVVRKAVLHKGVHYFDLNYHRGIDWYRAHFPTVRAAERSRDRYGMAAQTFESSPYYLYHPLAAGRIGADLPDVRAVVLVRDPVERAYSQHAHELARRFEPEASFARALELEPTRLAGEEERLIADPTYHGFSHQHHAYRGRGEYATHLERLAGALGREQILVVESERFFSAPGDVYDEVLAFLRLPRLDRPPFARHNARPRPAPLDRILRAELSAHYAPHDARLAAWLGRPPLWRAH
ncbi:sulfotransferase domain-containing protein [Pilimelia columellifera]|uniref:sulfotransferase domain-containing protein n=1 Tax=Pilimelia columellifera TaxID=706574 RepID=UPI0031CEED7E